MAVIEAKKEETAGQQKLAVEVDKTNRTRIRVAGAVVLAFVIGALIWVIYRESIESYTTLVGVIGTSVWAAINNRKAAETTEIAKG